MGDYETLSPRDLRLLNFITSDIGSASKEQYHTLCLGDEMPEISMNGNDESTVNNSNIIVTDGFPKENIDIAENLPDGKVFPSQYEPSMLFPINLETENTLYFRKEKIETGYSVHTPLFTEAEIQDGNSSANEKLCQISNLDISHTEKFSAYPQNHAEKLIHQCSICDKRFKSRSRLYIHVKRHNRIRPHQCNKCKFQCTAKSDLNHHHLRHENKRNFECKVCKRRFVRKIELNYHIKNVHLRDKCSKCTCCNFTTYSKNILRYHYIRKHLQKVKLQCPKCAILLYHKRSLLIHMRMHTGERPFACNQCQKSFRSNSELSMHLKIHFARTIECPMCKHKFSKKSNLTQHMRVHINEKLHICHLCPYRSNWKSTLIRHIRTIHKTNNLCPNFVENKMKNMNLNTKEQFENDKSKTLNKNMVNGVHKCSMCLKIFNTKEYLKIHLRTHTGIGMHHCSECNKMFKRKSELNSHMNVHKENNLDCKICGCKFKSKSNLTRHLTSHSGFKPYSCLFCDYASNVKTSVTRHALLKHGIQNYKQTVSNSDQ